MAMTAQSIISESLADYGQYFESSQDIPWFYSPSTTATSPKATTGLSEGKYVAVCRHILGEHPDYRLLACGHRRLGFGAWIKGFDSYHDLWVRLARKPDVVGSSHNPCPRDVFELWVGLSAKDLAGLECMGAWRDWTYAVRTAARILADNRKLRRSSRKSARKLALFVLRHPAAACLRQSEIKRLSRCPKAAWLLGVEGVVVDYRRIDWSLVSELLKKPDFMLRYAPKGALWVAHHGRKPKDKDLVGLLGRSFIPHFDFKVYNQALKVLGTEMRQQDAMFGACGLSVIFGRGSWRQYLQLAKKRGLAMHDATYWLGLLDRRPDMTSENPLAGLGKWILGYMRARTDSATGYLHLLTVITRGWTALSATEKALPAPELVALIKSKRYVDATHEAFAAEAAFWGVGEDEYGSLEQQWLETVASRGYDDIPSVCAEMGGYRMYRLADTDPRGLFLGGHTDCCQHPGGAGRSCAWHGVGIGCFYVIEDKSGGIVAQSWTWRTGDVVCFDSIEGKGEMRPCVATLYQSVAEAMVGRLMVSSVHVGACHVHMPTTWKVVDAASPPSGYTDASSQRLIAKGGV